MWRPDFVDAQIAGFEKPRVLDGGSTNGSWKGRAVRNGAGAGISRCNVHRRNRAGLFRRQARTLAASAIQYRRRHALGRNSTKGLRAEPYGRAPDAFPAVGNVAAATCSSQTKASSRSRKPKQNRSQGNHQRQGVVAYAAAASRHGRPVPARPTRYKNLKLYDGSMGEWGRIRPADRDGLGSKHTSVKYR